MVRSSKISSLYLRSEIACAQAGSTGKVPREVQEILRRDDAASVARLDAAIFAAEMNVTRQRQLVAGSSARGEPCELTLRLLRTLESLLKCLYDTRANLRDMQRLNFSA